MNRRNFLRATTAAVGAVVTGTTAVNKLSEAEAKPKAIQKATQSFTQNQSFTYSTGGVERMRIDSDGNVGISSTSPKTKLYVS